MSKKIHPKSERGQAIIIIVLGIVGLLAFAGLMADGGILFIQYSRLKRATDAAAVAAALQYRAGYTPAELNGAAIEFVQLNQLTAYNIIVDTCVTDNTLCTMPRRKLVRVTVSMDVDFGFLPILGIDGTTISTSATGEAASVDVVLVIDTSASMAYETGGEPDKADHLNDDPSVCNLTNSCQPFKDIKAIAKTFVDTLYFPYDRVAIIALTGKTRLDENGDTIETRDPRVTLHLSDDKATVMAAIDNLTVFQPPNCDLENDYPDAGTCLDHFVDSETGEDKFAFNCPVFYKTGDPSSCTSSNIGYGLLLAGNEFAYPPSREDSLWVTIILAGGPANASTPQPADEPYFPYGYCPEATWDRPYCRDSDLDASGNPLITRHAYNDPLYDADDYARDMADFVADSVDGQGAVVFSIGLGKLVREGNPADGLADSGENLLEYAALDAGSPNNNPGAYYYAPSTAELVEVFRKIAENIATRITQ